MLSGIKLVSKEDAERLDAETKHRKKSKDKREKKRKHKKEKRERHDHERDRGDSDGSASEPPSPRGPPNTAATTADEGGGQDLPSEPGLQREDWMTVPMGRSLVPPPSSDPEEGSGDDSDHPKVSKMELNPYLRKGGGAEAAAAEAAAAAGLPAPGVGDGGASWRMKALRRARSQAAEEGRSLNDMVEERWGSLAGLTQGITQRKAAPAMAHARAARERREAAQGSGDEEKRGRGGGGGSRMRRPSEADLESMSWRKDRGGGSGAGSGRESGQGGEGMQERHESDAAALKAVAGEMNAFSNDGSFMEQFLGKAKGGGEEREEEEEREKPRERSPAPKARRPPPMPSMPSQQQKMTLPHRPAEQQQRPQQQLSPESPRSPKSGGAGNLSAAAALRARLGGKGKPSVTAERTVVLPLVDAEGRAAPGAFGRESAGGGAAPAGRPAKRVERYEGGERKRYYADDDNVDLDTLVKRAKHGDGDDVDATMARNISRRARFKATELDADAEYDHDAGLELADAKRGPSKDARRRGTAPEEAAQRQKAAQVREYTRFQSAMDRCELCFTSKARQKHLTLAIGTVAYLALPSRGRLVPGHCQIAPAEHLASTRVADEATWTEIRNFKKCLLQMYAAKDMDCIFVETAARQPGDARAHAVVDCVPVTPEVFARAPMYFRKAIEDARSEWSQHAAKAIIDTTTKGLRGAIPPNFPYMHVEFGLASGIVHVIDELESFDQGLARGVLVGLLRLPEEEMHRRARRESEALQRQWAAEFRSVFEEYDWTKQL